MSIYNKVVIRGGVSPSHDLQDNYFALHINKLFDETTELGRYIVNNINTEILPQAGFIKALIAKNSFIRIACDVESKEIFKQKDNKGNTLEIQEQKLWGFTFYYEHNDIKYHTSYFKIQDFINDLQKIKSKCIKKITLGVCNLEYEGVSFDGFLKNLLNIKTGIKRNPKGLKPWSAEYILKNDIKLEIIDVQRVFTMTLDKNGEIFFGKNKDDIDFKKDWLEFETAKDITETKMYKYNMQDCNITLGLMEMAFSLCLTKKKIPYTMGGLGIEQLKYYLVKIKNFMKKDEKFYNRKQENTYNILKDATNGAFCEAFEIGDIINNTDFDKYNLAQIDFVNQYGSVCCRDEFPNPLKESVKTLKPDFWNKEGCVYVRFLKFIKMPQPIVGYKLQAEKIDNERKIFSDNFKGTFCLIYPEMRQILNEHNLIENIDYEIIFALERERMPYNLLRDFFEGFSIVRNNNLENKAIVQLTKDLPNAVTGKFGQNVANGDVYPWFADALLNAYILFGGRNMLMEYMQIIKNNGGEIIKAVTDSIMFRLPKKINMYDILPITKEKILQCVNIEHEFTKNDKVFVADAKRYIINDKLVFSSFASPKQKYGYENFMQDVDKGEIIDKRISPVKTITMAKKYPEFMTGDYFIWQNGANKIKLKISRGLKYNCDKITKKCKIKGRPWKINVSGFAYNQELISKA